MERTFSLDTRGVLEHCQTSKMDCLNNSAKIIDRVLNTALDTSQNDSLIKEFLSSKRYFTKNN